MNDLIEWLVNYAFDHNIGCILTRGLKPETPSASYGDKRLVIINMNWKNHNEIPFSFAHEIGHILNGDKGIHQFTATASSKEEYRANIAGIHLLDLYCQNHDLAITNPLQFCELFGIPEWLDYIVANQIYKHKEGF